MVNCSLPVSLPPQKQILNHQPMLLIQEPLQFSSFHKRQCQVDWLISSFYGLLSTPCLISCLAISLLPEQLYWTGHPEPSKCLNRVFQSVFSGTPFPSPNTVGSKTARIWDSLLCYDFPMCISCGSLRISVQIQCKILA